MAHRGAQPGNRNATKTKRWTQAIDKALKQFQDKKLRVKAGEALDRIAKLLVKEALQGDWWAVTEIGNRLDGKPAQSIDVTGEITHVRELSDAELLERLDRESDPAGAVDPSPGSTEPPGIH